MKIILVTDRMPPEQTTVGKIVLASARQYAHQGHQVSILTSTRNRAEEGESDIEGIQVFKVYANYHARWIAYLSLYNPQVVSKVKQILSREKPDIVHAHNLHHYLSYHSLKIAKKMGVRVFLTAHDVMLFHYGKLVEHIDPKNLECPDKFDYKIHVFQQIKRFKKRYNPFRNLIIRYYLGYVDKIFAVSRALRDALNQNGIESVEIIYNGINTSDWRANPEVLSTFKSKYSLEKRRVVLFGGRLSRDKGGEQALLAISKVVKNTPEVVLLVIGSKNKYAEEMSTMAQSLGIEQQIMFTGWLEGNNLRAAYHSCDLLLVPSICFDSFPTVILEAMACAKPVVATCFGGAREAVVNGKTGYIINPFNTSLMAERMVDLLSDPSKIKDFGNAGYDRIKGSFSSEKQISELLDKFAKM